MRDPTAGAGYRRPTTSVPGVQPPVAERRPHTWTRPTGDVDDPYAWLLDTDDPATLAYLEAENTYCAHWFDPHETLKEQLFTEIRSRVQETDTSVPVRKGPWWYVGRTEEGKAYGIHCRGRSRESADEFVLLDENIEATGSEYFAIGAFDVSPSHGLLAWSHDRDGSEQYVLQVRNLASGTDLPDRIEGTYYGTAWSADDAWLFYTVPDEAMRPFQVWRHRVGTPQSDDVLVLEETDERFFVDVDLSRSGEWIVIGLDSKETSEAWIVAASDPTAAPRCVRPRQQGHEYAVDHWGDRFVILTNLDAEDFRVMSAPLDQPGEWDELVPHTPGCRIGAAEPFATHLVLHEWADAQPRLRLLFRNGTDRVIDTGNDPSDVELSANPDYGASTLRFDVQSLVLPRSTFEEDVRSGARTLLKQVPTPNVDLAAYATIRTWATAPDGERVPVDLVWRHTTSRDASAPLLLYGYGSYEASLAPWFSGARLSLLDRGWVWALAHPRGGGELGRRWYRNGKLLNKRNTFTDFIACAEHLIAQQWCDPARVAIEGGSAGGLLVGACTTMRPELFASVVAEVPFVDIVSTMSDPSLPLTVTEWEEWGDPRSEPFASYMLSYSPYDNTGTADYPAMYITAGLNDPRVSVHEPAKWAARLRSVNTGTRPILMKTEMGAGHGGPSGRYDAWRDIAQTWAFLLANT